MREKVGDLAKKIIAVNPDQPDQNVPPPDQQEQNINNHQP